VWAKDKAECIKRVKARLAAPGVGWANTVINVLYKMVDAEPDNAQLMNRLANSAARALSDLPHEEEQNPDALYPMWNQFTKAQIATIFGGIVGSAADGGKLAIHQLWMNVDDSKTADFMTTFNAFAPFDLATKHLRQAWVDPKMGKLLPSSAAAAPSEAQMKLALWGVTGDRSSAKAAAFLKKGGSPTALAGGFAIGDLLDGTGADEHGVLVSVGLAPKAGAPPKPGKTAPTPNVDLDGDGTNDFFIEPLTRHGVVAATELRIRARPGAKSKVIGSVTKGTELYIIGTASGWHAVEQSPHPGFVLPAFVTPKAAPV
jgi:hypothetical protein